MQRGSPLLQPKTFNRDGRRRRTRTATLRQQRRRVRVAELMGPPRTVRSMTALEDLWTFFINDETMAVAVLDDEGRFQGKVTQADFDQRFDDGSLTAGDLVGGFWGSVDPRASVGQAVALMVLAGIQVLPVIELRSGKLVGLVAMRDVLRWLAEVSGDLRGWAGRPRPQRGAERAIQTRRIHQRPASNTRTGLRARFGPDPDAACNPGRTIRG